MSNTTPCQKAEEAPIKSKRKRGPKQDAIHAQAKIEAPVCGRNSEDLKRVLCEIIDRYNPTSLEVYEDGSIQFRCKESYRSLLRGDSKKEINPSNRSEGN